MPRMPELLDQALAERRAAQRCRDGDAGIGAAVWWDETRAGRDRIELRVIVTDRRGRFATFLVALPLFESPDHARVEEWVERRALGYPAATRLRDLVASAQGGSMRMPALAGAAQRDAA